MFPNIFQDGQRTHKMRVENQLLAICRLGEGVCFLFLVIVVVRLEAVLPLVVRVVGGKVLLSGAWHNGTGQILQNVCQVGSLVLPVGFFVPSIQYVQET